MTQKELAYRIINKIGGKVAINVELVGDKNKLPHYWDGKVFKYCGVSESECDVVYVRQIDDITTIPNDIGGCNVSNSFKERVRLVVFKRQFTTNHSLFIMDFAKILEDKEMNVIKVITNADRLSKLEMEDNYISREHLYFAIDVELTQHNNPCCKSNIIECQK